MSSSSGNEKAASTHLVPAEVELLPPLIAENDVKRPGELRRNTPRERKSSDLGKKAVIFADTELF